MENKIPLITPVKLIKTNKGAYILKKSGKIQTLTPTQALVLSLCNGTLTILEIAELISKIYKEEIEKVKKDIENFLELQRDIMIYLSHKLSSPLLIYEPKDFAFIPDYSDHIIRPKGLAKIGIAVNESCLCNCNYCYAAAPPSYKVSSSYIDFPIVKKFLKEAKELGANELVVGGGSVELYPHLIELVEYACEKLSFISVEISIKPVFPVKKEIFQNLRKRGLKHIQISLDSVSPLKLEKIVGVKNIFESMIITIYNAIEAGLDVAIRPTLTNENIDEIEEMAEFLWKIGVKYLRLVQVAPTGRGKFEFTPQKEKLENLEKNIFELKKNFPTLEIGVNVYKVGKVAACEGGRLSCFLYPSGELSLCDFVFPFMKKYNLIFGNIKEKSLEEIWNSSIMDKYRSLRYNDEICEKCDVKQICLGGCRMLSYVVFKNPNLPDPLCDKVYEHYEKIGEIFTSWKVKRKRQLEELSM